MTVLHRGLEQEAVVLAVLQVTSKSFDFEITYLLFTKHIMSIGFPSFL